MQRPQRKIRESGRWWIWRPTVATSGKRPYFLPSNSSQSGNSRVGSAVRPNDQSPPPVPLVNMTNRFVLLAAVVLVSASRVSAQDTALTIFAGRVLDVATGAYDSNVVLTIRNGIIADVRKAARRPDVANLVDLSAFTVLPGLIDAHAHLCDNSHMEDAFDHMAYPAPTFGIVGAVNALTTLRAGFTTVRDVSEPGSTAMSPYAMRSPRDGSKDPPCSPAGRSLR